MQVPVLPRCGRPHALNQPDNASIHSPGTNAPATVPPAVTSSTQLGTYCSHNNIHTLPGHSVQDHNINLFNEHTSQI